MDDTEPLILTNAFQTTAAGTELKGGCSTTFLSVNGASGASKAGLTTAAAIETLFVHNAHGTNALDLELVIATT